MILQIPTFEFLKIKNKFIIYLLFKVMVKGRLLVIVI